MLSVRRVTCFIQKTYFSTSVRQTLACVARTGSTHVFNVNTGVYSCKTSNVLPEQICKKIASVQRCKYCSSAPDENDARSKENNEEMDSCREIFRYKKILYARGLSRLKIYQTAFGVASLPFLGYSYSVGAITSGAAGNAVFVLTLSTAMLYALSLLIQKMVCILKFDKATQTVHISHLTFWGQRRDISLPLSSFEPTTDSNQNQTQGVIRLQTYDKKESFLIVLDSCTEKVKKEVKELFE
ncbi:hypothetical protein ACF0H5_001636 [Mactra antiquata]